MNRNQISVSISIRVGEQVMKVSDSQPLFLSGDRRRWRKQIADHVAKTAEILGQRFGTESIAIVTKESA